MEILKYRRPRIAKQSNDISYAAHNKNKNTNEDEVPILLCAETVILSSSCPWLLEKDTMQRELCGD